MREPPQSQVDPQSQVEQERIRLEAVRARIRLVQKRRDSATKILYQFELDTILLNMEWATSNTVQQGTKTMEGVRNELKEKGYEIFESLPYTGAFPHSILLFHPQSEERTIADFYGILKTYKIENLYHSQESYSSR